MIKHLSLGRTFVPKNHMHHAIHEHKHSLMRTGRGMPSVVKKNEGFGMKHASHSQHASQHASQHHRKVKPLKFKF